MTAKKADVTTAQGQELRRMANSKGISRQQFQTTLRTVFPRILDAIGSGKRVVAVDYPSWGNAVFVDDVPVCLHRDWSEAINETGSDTPDSHIVHRMGHLYPPTGWGVIRANFVLVSNQYSCLWMALDWAKQYGLSPASPRHVFALARHKPNLHHEMLKIDPAYVASPIEQEFWNLDRLCGVWFHGGSRRADAKSSGYSHGADGAHDWLAFLRE